MIAASTGNSNVTCIRDVRRDERDVGYVSGLRLMSG